MRVRSRGTDTEDRSGYTNFSKIGVTQKFPIPPYLNRPFPILTNQPCHEPILLLFFENVCLLRLLELIDRRLIIRDVVLLLMP